MKSFSQRKGLKATLDIAQVDGMSDELRASLWNVLDFRLWSSEGFTYKQYGNPEITGLARWLWAHHFKEPMDTIPDHGSDILKTIRKRFFGFQWFEVYDFLESIVAFYKRAEHRRAERLVQTFNDVLIREVAGYRFVGATVTDITSPEEHAMLVQALADNQFVGVAAHLQRALELYADRENPDYRNSVKESISAVEAMARIVSANPKATLGDALKAIEKNGSLHTALKEGFLKLYGYTSDEGGIRHAMLDQPNLTQAEARYFLLSCSSFSNYLKSKVAEER